MVNLFDESDIEVKKLNNKKCISWLGSVDIPLSAFCCPDGVSFYDILTYAVSIFPRLLFLNFFYLFQMRGFIKINLPHVLLGYETEAEKYRTKSPKISNVQSHQTYLEMEISLQPNVPKLFPNMVQR